MTSNRKKKARPGAASEALRAYVKLVRAAESVTRDVHEHLREQDLSISQFSVLEALHHRGPLSQVDLAKKILKTSGNITMVVDNLEKRGLVRRKRGERDRRLSVVHLTAAGGKLISEIFPGHAWAIGARMDALTADERKTLARLCRKLGLGRPDGEGGGETR